MEISEESVGTSTTMEISEESSGGCGENTDPQLWHACAGGMVQLPPVGSEVLYFPQGHGEQAEIPPEFPQVMVTKSSGMLRCRVMSVTFLADPETDEVYARMILQKLPTEPTQSHSDSAMDSEAGPASPPPEKTISFVKILTVSDASPHGELSVPWTDAETIFPPLDYSIGPVDQTVVAKDVHGKEWRFLHVYRGSPRRHLLTTGWTSFLTKKKLVAGDAIVLLRNASGELCIGVRRPKRGTWGSDFPFWSGGNGVAQDPGSVGFEPEIVVGGSSKSSSFTRNRARVTAQSVLDTAWLALTGEPFEIVSYPRASTAEFCVKEQSVKKALEQQLHWYPGMWFKMAFEFENSMTWFTGTIVSVQPCDPHWPKSPWRLLQVNWDDPNFLQHGRRVSPWQVNLMPILLPTETPFSRRTTIRLSEIRAEVLSDIPTGARFPCRKSLQPFDPANYNPNPLSFAHRVITEDDSAGMEGLRHEFETGLDLTQPF